MTTEQAITRNVREGYVFHISKGNFVKGPGTVTFRTEAEKATIAGQEWKLEPAQQVAAIQSAPNQMIDSPDEPRGITGPMERPKKKTRKRGKRGRSAIRATGS